jgi:hypothetical protein
MRSGWDRDALYLCAKMGPMHYRHCANQGHFVIDAYGTELVIGPGYAHEGSEFHDYTDKYMCGDGMSHNTISIDGVGQKEGRRGKHALRQLDNLWYTNETFDYLEGEFDFAPQGIGVVHRRSILFVKPDYWLVIDRLEEEGDDQVHTFRMKTQLDKDLVTEQTGDWVHARNPSTGVGLHVQPFDGDADLEIVKGQKEPRIEGWLAVSVDAWPAPAAIYTKQARTPVGFETLLCPECEGLETSVDTEKSGSVLTARIARGDDTLVDTFLISGVDSYIASFKGRLGWVRSGDEGLISASLIDGLRLHLAEAGLDLQLDRPGTVCVARTPDGGWDVSADLMNHPGITGTLNGVGFQLAPGLTTRVDEV